MFLSLNKKRKQVSKSRMKQNQISCLYSVGPVKHKHKCKQYKIHLEFLEKEKTKRVMITILFPINVISCLSN